MIFEGPNVDKIRKNYGLNEKNFFTVGSSAELYFHGENIFRLSTDCSSHCLISMGQKEGWAVPKIYQDYGALLESDEDPEWNHYWLGEFEKLEELDVFPDLKTSFVIWLDEMLKGCEEPLLYKSDIIQFRENLRSQSKNNEFEALSNTLIEICNECENDGQMDMDISNFMVRAKTKEVLVIDPAHGMTPCP